MVRVRRALRLLLAGVMLATAAPRLTLLLHVAADHAPAVLDSSCGTGCGASSAPARTPVRADPPLAPQCSLCELICHGLAPLSAEGPAPALDVPVRVRLGVIAACLPPSPIDDAPSILLRAPPTL